MKLQWKVSEAPTGPYRAFYDRAWPVAYYKGTSKPAVFLHCPEGYVPALVKDGKHSPITIIVLHHNHPDEPTSWKRFQLKAKAVTLEQAKQRAEAFLMGHPDWWPKDKK